MCWVEQKEQNQVSGPMPRRTSSIAMMRRALPGLEIIIGLAHRGIGPPCIGPPALALANEGLESNEEEVRLGAGPGPGGPAAWFRDYASMVRTSVIILGRDCDFKNRTSVSQ